MGIDLRTRWKRRLLIVASCIVYFLVIALSVELKTNHIGFWIMLAAYAWLMFFSVLRVADFEGASKEKQRRLRESFFRVLINRPRLQTDVVQRDATQLPPDEREQQEYEKAMRRTVGWLPSLMGAFAGQYAFRRQPIGGMEVAADILLLCAAMLAGPRIILLWKARDPREDDGLQLVQPIAVKSQ
jgi:hypothetical protein